MLRITYALFTALLLLQGCNSVKTILKKELPPYEAYIKSLEKASLLKSPMAQTWLAAGERAMSDSVRVSLPFTETGFFSSGQPEARSYRFDMKEGQVLTIEGVMRADTNTRVFMDLFVLEESQWQPVAFADSTLTLTYEFRDDQNCLLRIQPELLADVYYSVIISATPVLINPVSGANNRSIRSFYGDTRDGGRRSHEGLDIFAPRGTPVVAPTSGVIYNVGTNRLGGKVVWMRDSHRGHAYYFAHLDSQLVSPGKRVQQGDTLGLVGNTGNARTTPPHLHFGIYQRGSKNPIHYIRQMEQLVERAPLDTGFQAQVFRVGASRVNMRSGPAVTHQVLRVLEQDHYVEVVGRSGEWYRVKLPDDAQGYVARRLLVLAEEGRRVVVAGPSFLLSEARESSVPVGRLEDSTEVEHLASYENFTFVKTAEGQAGWLKQAGS